MIRLALCAALASGCVRDLGPEVGPPQRTTCFDVDSDPRTEVSFATDIYAAIFEGPAHCTRCHTPTGSMPIGLDDSGLDLSTYETLLAGGARSGSAIVMPGMPCESVLVQKLGASPPYGSRMPLDGPPFLSAEELQRVADWIAEGALDD